jgi:RNA polymerase sigma factor (sigma-70 family)
MSPETNRASITLVAGDSAALYHACRGAAAAQTAAYQTLWRILYPPVFYLVRRQPDADDLAQECTQQALVRIHQRLIECHEPAAFRTWARRLACNLTIDELRRRQRLVALPAEEDERPSAMSAIASQPAPDSAVLADINRADLRQLLAQAPISERSHRAVVGRFLDDLPDESLAQTESDLGQAPVLPSHIQVTRAKNLSKLRDWAPLRQFLDAH